MGAGAAGLATAIFLRRSTPARSVLLLDGARSPGAKILVSGGSRCNVTNVAVSERDFWGGRSTIVRRVLRALPVAETIDFFREIGVPLHEEAGGKLFPDSNRARDVLSALLREAAAVGVTLVTGCRVTDIVRRTADTTDNARFRIITSRGDLRAHAVVLATGGLSLPKSGSDGAGLAIAARLGHTIVPTTPALDALRLAPSDPLHRALSGVSQEVELAVRIEGAIAIRLTGALLWTHFGASGPVAMNASRHWLRAQIEKRDVSIAVSFCPGEQLNGVDARWTRLAGEHPKQAVQTTLATIVPSAVATALLDALAIDGRATLAHFSRDDRRRLSRALVEWPLPVAGTRGYQYAEATAGGVAVTEIDPATMESRLCPGLYLVGEMLDVDGRIGGFNFQWAWSSGFAAGRGLALQPPPGIPSA
ncbi:MAG: NAD(P)/FAD-dependent oxidoreductase [Acidobacteria bacterium]|nr:NAD(P)/FAD-dependent oxidoreductase [Acidobacteriota bacterium]